MDHVRTNGSIAYAHDGKPCRECFIQDQQIFCPAAPHPWHNQCGTYGAHPHSAELCKSAHG